MLLQRAAWCIVLAQLGGCALGWAPAADPGPSPGHQGASPNAGQEEATPSAAPGDAPLAANPVLVVVDTDRKLSANPGDGVGIFIEYGSEGPFLEGYGSGNRRWHVWWTCDAKSTVGGCSFDLLLSSEGNLSDPLYDPHGPNGPPTSIDSTEPKEFRAHTTTLDTADGVTFSSEPGAVIRITAKIDGKNAAPFFFIEDGKINGGLQEQLTDPLLVRASVP
jgi:hypothetical protein